MFVAPISTFPPPNVVFPVVVANTLASFVIVFATILLLVFCILVPNVKSPLADNVVNDPAYCVVPPTIPSTLPVTLPVTSPVTSPVTLPVTLVVVNTPLLGL